MKAFLALLTSQVYALPTERTFGINTIYFTDNTCTSPSAQLSTKLPFGLDECYVATPGSLMKKQTLDTAGTGIAQSAYAGTDCSGTAAATSQFPNSSSCVQQTAMTSSNGNVYMTSVPWTPGSMEIVYGFYSDSACTTRDGITAMGFYSNQTGASGDCIADKPAPGYSTYVEYTDSVVSIKIHQGSTTCGATTTTDISGTIGSCVAVPASTATALNAFAGLLGTGGGFTGFTHCANTDSCYIYAFPVGALAGSFATSSSVAYMAMALVIGIFAILF